MVTIATVVKGIQDIIANKTGKTHHASRWSERLLYYHLNNYRVQLIWDQHVNKKVPISDYLIETIPCMPLVEVKDHECPCIIEGKTIKKTKYMIPQSINGNLEYVGDLGGNQYDYIQFENLGRPGKSIYKGRRDKNRYSLKTIAGKTYPYILEDPQLKLVSLKLIPKDPTELYLMPE